MIGKLKRGLWRQYFDNAHDDAEPEGGGQGEHHPVRHAGYRSGCLMLQQIEQCGNQREPGTRNKTIVNPAGWLAKPKPA